ncbi:MAG TPA: hypothetical protein VMP67_08270 [Candidatus Limnocylindria bacterium]|nr:hypothetical protein [Candidatus Limnocylindria bacterium]
MTDGMRADEPVGPAAVRHLTIDADLALRRAASRRRRRLRLLGTLLIAYGLLGIGLFAGVALAVDRPIDEAGRLTVSLEGQRGALLDSLSEASRTIDEAADGVLNMDGSLEQAQAATERAATLSVGVAASMYELRNAMGLSILGAQPLIGLAAGFDQTGQQLELLAQDVAAIGEALDSNRGDAREVAEAMDRLSASIETLGDSVRDGPALEVSSDALASMRLGLYAVIAWMLLLAAGCVGAGIYCWMAARSRA